MTDEARRLVSANNVVALVPSDTVDFVERPRAIVLGVAGDIAFVNEDDTVVTMTGLVAGLLYPIRPKRLNATGTTATPIFGLY